MGKLSERQRLILTIAVSVIITGGLLGLIFKDRTEIDAANEEIAALDTKIRLAEVEIGKIKGREERVLVYRAVEEKELEILPTKQEIASFHQDLSRYLQGAGLRFKDLPESTPVESGLAKDIHVTRTVLSCQGESSSLLRLLNMIENDSRLVAVKGLNLKAMGRRKGAEAGPPQHEIEVHLESYFYNPQAKVVQNRIPGAEERLEEDSVQEAIADFQPERPDTYLLRPAESRRDPLVDPRRMLPTVDPEAEAELFESQELIVVDLEKRADVIDEKLEQEAALKDLDDLFRYDQLRKEINEDIKKLGSLVNSVTEMNKVTLPGLRDRVKAVRNRNSETATSRVEPNKVITVEVAEGVLAEMQEYFKVSDYDKVTSVGAQWTMFKEGRSMDPAARPIDEAISVIRRRSKTLDEFQTFMYKVTGTIVHPVDPRRSVALVNGVARHTGDRLEEGGTVRIGEITRESVEFLYKGESIKLKRHKTGGAAGKPDIRTSIR